jgi:hypothetical protein
MFLADLRCPQFAMNIRRIPHLTARYLASFTSLIDQDIASLAR